MFVNSFFYQSYRTLMYFHSNCLYSLATLFHNTALLSIAESSISRQLSSLFDFMMMIFSFWLRKLTYRILYYFTISTSREQYREREREWTREACSIRGRWPSDETCCGLVCCVVLCVLWLLCLRFSGDGLKLDVWLCECVCESTKITTSLTHTSTLHAAR